MFNKDWNIFKTNWQNASGGFKNKFATIFNSNDVNCLKEYNRQIQTGIKPSVAYKATMMGCTQEAKKNAVAIAKGSMTYEQATSSIKGTTVAMKALSVAGNMLVFMAISKGIQLATQAIDNYIHRVEVAREKLEETTSELEGVESEIKDINSQIDELLAKETPTITDENDLKRLQEENRQLEIRKALLEAQKAEESADLNRKIEDKYRKNYSDNGMNTTDENGNFIEGQSTEEYLLQGIDKYKELISLNRELTDEERESMRLFREKALEHSGIIMEMTDGYIAITEEEKKQKAIWDEILEGVAYVVENEAGTIPDITNRLKDKFSKKELEDGTVSINGEMSKWLESLSDNDKKLLLKCEIENPSLDDLKRYLDEELGDVEIGNETTSLLGISETVNALNTKLKPAIDSITDAYQNIFTEDGFTRENINLEMFESLRSEIENMQGELGLDIDYSSFDNFVTVLDDTTSSTQDIQDAFDEVAFSITKAALEGIEDFSVLKETLKDLGYVNYEMTAFEALINNKEALLKTGLELANATDAEITAFVNETISAENASQAIAILTYAKQLNAVENMNTSGEVANLKTLAENAGVAADVIQHLTELEQIYQMVASGKYMPEQIQGMLNRAKELKGLIEESAKNISFAPKPNQTDWKPMIKSAKKAGKDAGEAYKDAVEQELNDLDSVINAVGDLISDHIDHLQDQCDAAVDALERERDAIIDSLEHEKKALEDAIKTKQDQIDAIREAREERSAELDLQKKEYELERLQNQRTRLVYSDSKGFHYEQDTSEIRDSKEAVDEAKENIKILQIEKEISVLEDSIDNIDDKIEEVNDHYDDLIAQTEQYWQSLIDGLENYKSRWEELGELKEQAEFKRQLEELGLSSVDILNMSEEAFQAFKTQYVDALDKYLQATGDGLSAVADTDLTSTADSVSKVADATTKIDDEKVANLSSAMEGLGDASNLDALYNAFDQLKTIITEISNTLNGVEDGNGLVKALSDLGTLSLGTTGEEATGLIGQFVALKEAIDAVTTAIGGGTDTGTNLTDRGFPSSTGVSKTSGSDGTSSGLKNTLKEQVEEATTLLPDEIAKFAGEEDSLEGAVQKVITKVAGASGEESGQEGEKQQSESGEADPTNLKGAIQAQYEKAEEVIVPLEVPMFEQLRDVILECVDGLNKMVTAMQSMSEMSLGGDIQFGLVNFHSEGTVGKAFAKGTGKYKGLSHDEKLAVRSEYGQPETTIYPDGTVELTTEPTASSLPKDTVILNEEQTKKMLSNKGEILGNAFANGTDISTIKTPSNLPSYLRPLQEGDRIYDLMKKFDTHNDIIQNQIIPPVNSIQKNMDMVTRNISNVNMNNKQSQVINQEFNITLPNVTDSTKADALMRDLQSISSKKVQFFDSSMHKK